MYTSKYFKPEEFKCKGKTCGCANKSAPVMDERLLKVLDKMREKVGKPLIVNCGYRCKKHNAEVGGVSNSFHQRGVAADISAAGIGVEKLAKIAEECGADGVGRYVKKNFVHVDTRGYRARWVE